MIIKHLQYCSILLLIANSLFASTVTLYTEEFPPFNYTKDDKIVGMATEVVEIVLEKAGIDYSIRSYPWARTYSYAQERSNALIFSISRRAKREELFQWVGIVVPSTQSVFALKNRTDINIETIEDLKNYRLGSTIEDARETYLMNNGFDLNTFQRLAGDKAYLRNYHKLKTGRIELWPIPDAVAYHIARESGEDPEKILHKVFEFSELSQGGYYIAASPLTSKEIVKAIRKALEEFKATPEYTRILTKWGGIVE